MTTNTNPALLINKRFDNMDLSQYPPEEFQRAILCTTVGKVFERPSVPLASRAVREIPGLLYCSLLVLTPYEIQLQVWLRAVVSSNFDNVPLGSSALLELESPPMLDNKEQVARMGRKKYNHMVGNILRTYIKTVVPTHRTITMSLDQVALLGNALMSLIEFILAQGRNVNLDRADADNTYLQWVHDVLPNKSYGKLVFDDVDMMTATAEFVDDIEEEHYFTHYMSR